MKREIHEGDVVLCTVDKIIGTAIFLKIEGDGEGTMVASEVAAGRIRNLRDYVVPNKKIVCKVLRIDSNNNINLSLRRVVSREKKEVLEKYEKERNSISILKSVLGVKTQKIKEKIEEKNQSVHEFLQNCKDNPNALEDYMVKEEAEKVCRILGEKKEKIVEVKKEFTLKSESPAGIELIKDTLMPYKDNIHYLAAGRFAIIVKAQDYKKANSLVNEILQHVEKKAKEHKAVFEIRK